MSVGIFLFYCRASVLPHVVGFTVSRGSSLVAALAIVLCGQPSLGQLPASGPAWRTRRPRREDTTSALLFLSLGPLGQLALCEQNRALRRS